MYYSLDAVNWHAHIDLANVSVLMQ